MSEEERRRGEEGPKRNRTSSLDTEDVDMTLEEHKTSEGRREGRQCLPVIGRFLEKTEQRVLGH